MPDPSKLRTPSAWIVIGIEPKFASVPAVTPDSRLIVMSP